MSPALKITGVVADYNLQIDGFNFPTIIVNIIIIIIIIIIIVIIIVIIIIIIITIIIIIPLYTLGSIYSTNASGAEQIPETNNSN